jgi:hypothetical protein
MIGGLIGNHRVHSGPAMFNVHDDDRVERVLLGDTDSSHFALRTSHFALRPPAVHVRPDCDLDSPRRTALRVLVPFMPS